MSVVSRSIGKPCSNLPGFFGKKPPTIKSNAFVSCRRNIMAGAGNQTRYLTQHEAINLDKELFDEYAFSVDQLMELAGLSVATAIARTYSLPNHNQPIVCCGPGNNGGDGLVCARHLKLFGYNPVIICPRPGKGQLFQNLLTQCQKFDIAIMDRVPEQQERFNELGNLIVDAVFGFSFKPPNRSPDYAMLLNFVHTASTKMPLVSIDIPSGWHVEKGDTDLVEDQSDTAPEFKIPALQPDSLISLTAPKLCAKSFRGRYHYLGGRFCPESLHEKYKLNLPTYPGEDCIVRLE